MKPSRLIVIDPCVANEPFVVDMRTVEYETERKRSRVGDSSSAGRKITAGRQKNRRGCQNRRCFQILGKAMASGRAERRAGGFEGQTTSRPQTPPERETEAAIGEGSFGRTVQGRLPYRPLDLSASGQSDCREVPCELSSGSRVEDSPQFGMDTPEARATGARAQRSGHSGVAQTRVAANKKGAKRELAPIVFLDESGFMLQPVRRRTWAPSGQTPLQDAWDRHDRLSVVGLIGVSPLRHRLSLYFQLLPKNADTDQMVELLQQLHHHYRRQVILVWDRLSAHRSAAAYFEEERPDWFDFEWLPAYAPELNPVEQCWNHTKYADLPNFIPDDLDHLQTAVYESMLEQREDQALLRSFFAHAKLPL